MPKEDNAKPKGRKTAYACFVQTCREEHKKKHPDENVIFADFSKKCSERWKVMSDKEKQRFKLLAEKDKKRFENEIKNYVPPKEAKKKKRSKDPNAPKRSLSAFFWFCNDERPKVKAEMPEASVGTIAKELGKRWSNVTDELKKKYGALATKDKARYEKECETYRKKQKTSSSSSSNNKKNNKKEESEEDDEDDDEEEGE